MTPSATQCDTPGWQGPTDDGPDALVPGRALTMRCVPPYSLRMSSEIGSSPRSAGAEVALLSVAAGILVGFVVAVGLLAGMGALALALREVLHPSEGMAGIVAAVVVYLFPIPTGVYLGVRAGQGAWRRLAARRA